MLHRYKIFKTDFTAFVILLNSRLIRPSVISLLLFSLVLYYSFVHKLLFSRSPRAKKVFSHSRSVLSVHYLFIATTSISASSLSIQRRLIRQINHVFLLLELLRGNACWSSDLLPAKRNNSSYLNSVNAVQKLNSRLYQPEIFNKDLKYDPR